MASYCCPPMVVDVVNEIRSTLSTGRPRSLQSNLRLS